VGAEVIVMNYDDTLTLEVGVLIEEYEYARSEYKNAIGDQQRDFWDGYLAAIEKLCPDVAFDET